MALQMVKPQCIVKFVVDISDLDKEQIMKAVAVILGLGCCQLIVDGVADLLPAPYAIVRTQTPPVEEKWY